MNNKIKIDIWSDVVCPYCYLGFKKLEQALKNTGLSGYFEYEWHSFQLDPEFPADHAELTTSYLAIHKNLSESQIEQMHKRLIEQGVEYGIDYQFGKALSFNTLNAHKLLQWSKTKSKATELEKALFNAYFTQGEDLSKPETLFSICESIGLDRREAESVILDRQYAEQIEEDKYTASQFGIRGVPYFIIGEKYPVSGAMPDSVFELTLRNVFKHHPDQQKLNDLTNGESCSMDGSCL